jgi:hypothetical protein
MALAIKLFAAISNPFRAKLFRCVFMAPNPRSARHFRASANHRAKHRNGRRTCIAVYRKMQKSTCVKNLKSPKNYGIEPPHRCGPTCGPPAEAFSPGQLRMRDAFAAIVQISKTS